MRFGIKTVPEHTSWGDMLDVWRAADEIELFETAWNFDHFYPIIGDGDGPCLEAWVTLSALAQATSRIRIGCMVNGVPYRHPALVANMAASLDIVSGGRLELGLGAGWNEQETEAYGIDLLPIGQRMDRFEEAVEVVDSLLSNEFTTFRGKYFQLEQARCEPKGPQQPRPPIVIGGAGEKRTLRIAARFAQHWNISFVTPDQFIKKNEILLTHCESVGRDSSLITRSVQIISGADQDPVEVADEAAALFAAGVDKVIFMLSTPYRAERVTALAKSLEAIST
ncbi:MAG TPA: LLM class F420-dependent oxidoreductase [Gammaproteobacteria bacterium]|jgi:F420-dependent oxidoreductase-like protein|nr:LLM class F420-dependent oxidoreductase [Gammaproteobacteria bacterium]|tara:strand:- start:258 stop:1100 length:843 start_codon:yes stop_codon:yes gene_type:complete